MIEDSLFFANMTGGFTLIRRCSARRSFVCASRMSAAKDGASSLDKLRSMQQSIMRRRKDVAREISTSSEAIEREASAPETTVQPSTSPASENENSKVVERKSTPLKRGRPPKSKMTAKQHPVTALPSLRDTGLAVDGSGPEAGMHSRAKQSNNSEGNLLNIASSLSGRTNKLRTAETAGKFNCFLEKCDGNLPFLKREKLAIADPVLIRIPQLIEFTAPVPLKKGHWLLPRVDSFHPFGFAATSHTELTTGLEIPAACESILDALNPEQRAAVGMESNQACLVLAGPGSGKTRVLTHRAAYLVRRYNLQPYRILAVTFTNKAAEEMKTRLRNLLSEGADNGPWSSFQNSDFVVGTFHSICARLLRVHGSCIGIDPYFQICDASDARQVVQFIMKASASSQADAANKATVVASMISKLKNNGEEEMKRKLPRHLFREVTQYRASYDKKLRDMNQLDFDDLLLETRRMLDESPDVLQELHNRYLHVLVDEWQDTNSVQFDIVAALAKKHGNLFVVGDADQSIYKFRGADIRNVTRFTKMFPNAQTVALEENYRSTGCIVNAAQAIIEGNRGRPNKPMRTSNEFGSLVTICKANDGRAEGSYIVSRIRDMLKTKKLNSLAEVAVLYRMNSQSRQVEEAFINASMPYRLVAGTRFYDRQEVKDVLSYIRLLVNPMDDMALLRAINTPPRGIGKKTVEALQEIASGQGVSILQALERVCDPNIGLGASDENDDSATLRKGALKKLAEFLFIIEKLRSQFGTLLPREEEGNRKGTAADVIEKVIKLTDYKAYLEKRSLATGTKEVNKFEERWQNIEELESAASRYSTLSEFMESVSLLSKPAEDEDEKNPTTGRRQPQAVSLMTMHAGKGLEFTAVFIAGAEDGLLPMARRGAEDEAENIAEERRLAYVGMTRAKQYLTLSWRERSLVFSSSNGAYWRDSKPSRFLQFIPDNLVKQEQYPFYSRSGGRLSKSAVRGQTVYKKMQWHVGDSVRCAKYGRGTIITKGRGATTMLDESDAEVEVLFSDGRRHFINPIVSSLELLYSPTTST